MSSSRVLRTALLAACLLPAAPAFTDHDVLHVGEGVGSALAPGEDTPWTLLLFGDCMPPNGKAPGGYNVQAAFQCWHWPPFVSHMKDWGMLGFAGKNAWRQAVEKACAQTAEKALGACLSANAEQGRLHESCRTKPLLFAAF